MNAISNIVFWLHIFDHVVSVRPFCCNLGQTKYIKIHEEEISSLDPNAFEFFCVPLCSEYLPDHHKKFELWHLHMIEM